MIYVVSDRGRIILGIRVDAKTTGLINTLSVRIPPKDLAKIATALAFAITDGSVDEKLVEDAREHLNR